MKEIILTQGQVSQVDDEYFERVNQFKWRSCWDEHTQSFYAIRNLKKENGKYTTQRMSRFIMGVTDPKIKVDHISHDTLNDQISNLRVCTNSQNLMNRRKQKTNTSGVTGVSRKKDKRWQAYIKLDGKKHHLGCFDDLEEAKFVRKIAEIELFGEYAFRG